MQIDQHQIAYQITDEAQLVGSLRQTMQRCIQSQ